MKKLRTKQSAEAKKIWRNTSWEDGGACFRWNKFPALVSFIDERLPHGQVIILGGGRGHVGSLLSQDRRTFLNVEIAKVPDPLVPTIQGDMEEKLERGKLRREGRNSVLTPFSIEYTSMELSTRNIAEILEPSEIWVSLCHHSESCIVKDFENAKLIYRLISIILEDASRTDVRNWWPMLAVKAETALIEIYGRYTSLEESLVFAEYDRLLEIVQICKKNDGLRMAKAYFIPLWLSVSRFHPEKRGQILQMMAALRTIFEMDVVLSKQLLDKQFKNPEDVAARVDSRLRLIDGGVYEQDEIKVVYTSFQKI